MLPNSLRQLITRNSFLIIAFFLACSDPFAYSPFEVVTNSSLRNTTQKNLQRISVRSGERRIAFKVALLSDSHYHYKELADAIQHINRRDDIEFIFVVGDITENGLQKEFELFHSVMAKAKTPYLTVIGNHDHLSNGGKVYREIYGDHNYSFVFSGAKFIIWDNIFWESEKHPDFDWLKNELESNGKPFRHIVPLAHIPPTDQQFQSTKKRYHELLVQSQVSLSVHGHKHRYSTTHHFGDSIKFLTVGSPQYREYSILTFTNDNIKIEKIRY